MTPLWKDPTTWGAIFTFVIAGATIVYVIFTRLLWQETKKAADAAKQSADAARISADAAKQSADAATEAAESTKKSTQLLEALHRPYMGVSSVELFPDRSSQNLQTWQVAWKIKNFGTLPALGVEAKVHFFFGAELLRGGAGPRSAEIFPQSEADGKLDHKWAEVDRGTVMRGERTFVVRFQINYTASDGRKFEHVADAQFVPGDARFSVVKSETKTF